MLEESGKLNIIGIFHMDMWFSVVIAQIIDQTNIKTTYFLRLFLMDSDLGIEEENEEKLPFSFI